MIYTLTLNPAVDRELTIPEFRLDSVLRASASQVDYGGKGFNVSRLLQRMGTPSTAVGFAGGRAGELLRDGLQGLDIRTEFVWVPGETRTNISIVTEAHDRYIKVNETGPVVDSSKQAELIEKVASLAQADDCWVLAGSLPPGVEADYYARILAVLRERSARAILDTSGEPLRLGCAERPFLVKPNAEEAQLISGLPTGTPLEAARAADAIRRLGAETVVISMGSDGALLKSDEGSWLARSPQIEQKNPIGAGDAMVGGLVWALTRGLSQREALAWGVASGAATASLSGTEMGSRQLIEELYSQVQCDQI